MIGEIRDTETAKIAVRASITGHLVLSTIHTNDSLNTIERLLDMDVERYLLASALTGIISQKLARRLCPHCRKLRPTNDYEKSIIKKVLGKDVNEIYTTVGCDECKNGYNGRIAIHEVLMIDQNIKDAISSNVRKDKLRRLVYNGNVVSLLKDGIVKVLEGLTTLEELLKIIELDDDSNVNATGLDNAMEANELIKEDVLNHQLETNKEVNESIIKSNEIEINNEVNEPIIETNNNNDIEENLFESPESLTSTSKESITATEVTPQPTPEEKITNALEEKTNSNNITEQNEETNNVSNNDVEYMDSINNTSNNIPTDEDKNDDSSDNIALKLPSSNTKKSIFSNRKDLF
jgi:hypothetical protein